MSQRRRAVRLCGRSLSGPQLTGRCLVLDGALGEGTLREGLPADLPKLRASGGVLFVQHRARVVPDLVAVTDPEPRGAGGRDDVLAVGAPGEKCGVWSLRLGHLKETTQSLQRRMNIRSKRLTSTKGKPSTSTLTTKNTTDFMTML